MSRHDLIRPMREIVGGAPIPMRAPLKHLSDLCRVVILQLVIGQKVSHPHKLITSIHPTAHLHRWPFASFIGDSHRLDQRVQKVAPIGAVES